MRRDFAAAYWSAEYNSKSTAISTFLVGNVLGIWKHTICTQNHSCLDHSIRAILTLPTKAPRLNLCMTAINAFNRMTHVDDGIRNIRKHYNSAILLVVAANETTRLHKEGRVATSIYLSMR